MTPARVSAFVTLPHSQNERSGAQCFPAPGRAVNRRLVSWSRSENGLRAASGRRCSVAGVFRGGSRVATARNVALRASVALDNGRYA